MSSTDQLPVLFPDSDLNASSWLCPPHARNGLQWLPMPLEKCPKLFPIAFLISCLPAAISLYKSQSILGEFDEILNKMQLKSLHSVFSDPFSRKSCLLLDSKSLLLDSKCHQIRDCWSSLCFPDLLRTIGPAPPTPTPQVLSKCLLIWRYSPF